MDGHPLPSFWPVNLYPRRVLAKRAHDLNFSPQSRPVHTVLYYVFMERLSLPRLKCGWYSFLIPSKQKKKHINFYLTLPIKVYHTYGLETFYVNYFALLGKSAMLLILLLFWQMY